MKKARTISSDGRIIGTVFLDATECILVDFLLRKETVNTFHSIQTIQTL
jgi:hypothetical protein